MNPQISELSFYEQHPYFFEDSEIYYPESDGEPMGEAELEKLKKLLEKK